MLPLPFRQDGDAGSNLRLSDGGHEQVTSKLIVHPSQDLRVRTLPHQFGHNIGIEDKHESSPQSNRGGSRVASLGGISNSTPPNGLNSSCIAVPSSLFGAASSSRAARRMSRASCSMERPFSAARMRSRRFSPSSKLRTVILAKVAPHCSCLQYFTTMAMQSSSRASPAISFKAGLGSGGGHPASYWSIRKGASESNNGGRSKTTDSFVVARFGGRRNARNADPPPAAGARGGQVRLGKAQDLGQASLGLRHGPDTIRSRVIGQKPPRQFSIWSFLEYERTPAGWHLRFAFRSDPQCPSHSSPDPPDRQPA